MAPRPAARGGAPLSAASPPRPAPAGSSSPGACSPERRPPQRQLSRRPPLGRPTRAPPPRPTRPHVSPLAERPAGAGPGPTRRRGARSPSRPPASGPAPRFGSARYRAAPPARRPALPGRHLWYGQRVRASYTPPPADTSRPQLQEAVMVASSNLKKCFMEAAKRCGVRAVLPTLKMASGALGIAVPPLSRGRGNFYAPKGTPTSPRAGAAPPASGQAAAPGACRPPLQDHSSSPAAD